jgi:gamma-tubulin complex component 5
VKKIRICFPTQQKELLACPLFIKEISKSIVSAGKSWQLVRHVPVLFSMMSEIRRHPDINVPGGSTDDRGFKHLLTDLCRVNLAGDFVFRGHISRYF